MKAPLKQPSVELTLRLHLCKVDKFDRLRFIYGDDDDGHSYQVLDKAIMTMLGRCPEEWARLDGSEYSGPTLPHNDKRVKVCKPPKCSGTLLTQITDCIGMDCKVVLKVDRRTFKSKKPEDIAAGGKIIDSIVLTVVRLAVAI